MLRSNERSFPTRFCTRSLLVVFSGECERDCSDLSTCWCSCDCVRWLKALLFSWIRSCCCRASDCLCTDCECVVREIGRVCRDGWSCVDWFCLSFACLM